MNDAKRLCLCSRPAYRRKQSTWVCERCDKAEQNHNRRKVGDGQASTDFYTVSRTIMPMRCL